MVFMRIRGNKNYFLLVPLLFVAALNVVAQSEQPLVNFGNLKYLGAFRLPISQNETDPQKTLSYAVGPIAFNPKSSNNSPSLFIACFEGSGKVTEVSIPTPVISQSSKLSDLPTATIIQGCANVRSGASTPLNSVNNIGGLLVLNSKLVISIYDPYPAGACPSVTHFVKNSLNLSAADATGGFVVSNVTGKNCFVNGPMTLIPPEWQPLLGNKSAIVYNCCHSIIDQTSWGPAAFAFSPDLLGVTPTASTALQYYDIDHPTLGNWSGNDKPLSFEQPWDNSWHNALVPGYRGLVIPNGTRSALYFTAQGIGSYCYGEGVTDSTLHNRPIPGLSDVRYCYDPINADKGDHGYPYRFQVMAFDLNEWAAVVSGSKKPYDVKPYAVWPLTPPTVPFTTGLKDGYGGGAAYDPATKRIYWEQPHADGVVPIIQVWEVTTATPIKYSHSAQKNASNSIKVDITKSTVSIKLNNTMSYKTINLQLVNGAGDLIKEASLKKNKVASGVTWDLTSIPVGLYFLTIKEDHNIIFTDQILLLQ